MSDGKINIQKCSTSTIVCFREIVLEENLEFVNMYGEKKNFIDVYKVWHDWWYMTRKQRDRECRKKWPIQIKNREIIDFLAAAGERDEDDIQM